MNSRIRTGAGGASRRYDPQGRCWQRGVRRGRAHRVIVNVGDQASDMMLSASGASALGEGSAGASARVASKGVPDSASAASSQKLLRTASCQASAARAEEEDERVASRW